MIKFKKLVFSFILRGVLLIILLIQLIEIYRKYLPEIENYQKQYKPFSHHTKDCQNHKNYNRKK